MGKASSGFKADAIAWAQSFRFSALTVTLLLILLAAVIILTPQIGLYVQQRNELRELRESVELHQQALNEVEAQKLKWQDPVYIRAQARERLYYVMPGEKQIAVLTEGVAIPQDEDREVAEELTRMKSDWPIDIARSVIGAGMTSANPQDFLRY